MSILKKFLFPQSSQKFHVEYSAIVENTSQTQFSGSIIFPVIRNFQSQKILTKSSFTQSVQEHIDDFFGNTYGISDISIQGQSSLEVFQKCDIQIFKNFFQEQTDFQKQEYKNIENTPEYKKYLEGNSFVSSKLEAIQDIAKKLQLEDESVIQCLRKINQYVVENLTYGAPKQGLYSVHEALSQAKVDCGGFDTLFVSLCQSQGIPARVVSGFWAGYKENSMHAWVEALLPNGQWIVADPSVEHLNKYKRTKKNGKLGFVGSDRIIFSVGCDIPITIHTENIRTDILQNAFLISESNPDIHVRTKVITEKL